MNPRGDFSLAFPSGEPLELGRETVVMGILNVTPDSFSDGSRFATPAEAIDAAARMAADGAAIVDVGGESTRPGATEVDAQEEAARVLPVIEGIKRDLGVRVSIDTRKAGVARQALEAGADLVNDISALADPEMLPLVASRGTPVVLMHLRGTPVTMQQDTRYDDVVSAVRNFLRERVDSAIAAGLSGDKIVVDPGIGFGKSAAGNLAILAQLPAFASLGRPLLIGASRKSFVGKTLGLTVDNRLEASLAIAAYASARGAHIIRAHDVSETVRAVRMMDAIRAQDPGRGQA